ncbi:hypothetical protein V8D89_002660 [Ganoderma adspersum]
MSYGPEVVANFDNFFTNNRCAFAALTLLAYEYVFNIHREVDLFWKRKLSGASALFFFARYTPVLAYTIADVQFAPMSDTGCSVVVYTTLVLSGFQCMPWADTHDPSPWSAELLPNVPFCFKLSLLYEHSH